MTTNRHMTLSFRAFFAGFLLLAGLAVAGTAHAETKIAVVDVQTLMTESKAAKDIERQLKAHRDALEKTFSEKQEALRALDQSLTQRRKDMSAEDFQKEKGSFEKKILEARQMAEKEGRAMDKAAAAAIGQLKKEIIVVVADIADAQGYGLVMTRDNVLLAEKEMAITPAVMAALDKKLPSVKVDFAKE